MTLALKNVTVCAADCVQPALAARALSLSTSQCEFADAVLFTDTRVVGNFRTIPISPLRSRDDYSRFVLKSLAGHIATPFVLLVQWDGYVLNSACWHAEFTDFDYIGAHWPWHTDGMSVGNGGFSLRSRRLLEITARADFTAARNLNEDEIICRAYRPYLEQQFAIRIADIPTATRFAYERGIPTERTFGFHGLFNMWRHVSDDGMIEFVAQLSDGAIRSREFFELLFHYVTLKRFATATSLFVRLTETLSSTQVLALANRALGDSQLAARFIHQCEQIASTH